MGLFKNGVGRPSNETLKRRKVVYLCIITVLASLLCISVVLTVKRFKTVTGTAKNATMKQDISFQIVDNCSKNIHVTASNGLKKVQVEYIYTTKCKKWGLFKGTYYEPCDKTISEAVNLSNQTSYKFKLTYNNETLKRGTIYAWDKAGNVINKALATYC